MSFISNLLKNFRTATPAPPPAPVVPAPVAPVLVAPRPAPVAARPAPPPRPAPPAPAAAPAPRPPPAPRPSDAVAPGAIISTVPAPVPEGQPDLHGFVIYVVSSLVEINSPYTVQAEVEADRLVLRIQCAQGQVGRIIGKNGKTIEAIRLLVRDAAMRAGKKAKVVVADAA